MKGFKPKIKLKLKENGLNIGIKIEVGVSLKNHQVEKESKHVIWL
jgi:hypothetical protein